MIRVGSAPRGRLAIASGTLLLAFVATPSQDPADRVEDVPIESELIEEADVELAQFDVTVRGDPTVIASLAPEDFRIKLGLKRLREFRLDRLCPAAEEAGTLPASESTSRAAYLFYFDQPHLTQAGRQRALGLNQSAACFQNCA